MFKKLLKWIKRSRKPAPQYSPARMGPQVNILWRDSLSLLRDKNRVMSFVNWPLSEMSQVYYSAEHSYRHNSLNSDMYPESNLSSMSDISRI